MTWFSLRRFFTHFRGAEVRHYLDEFRRVLRPGAKCLTSCFMLNAVSEKLIQEGKSTLKRIYSKDDCYAVHPDVPESSLGFEETLLLSWLADRSFTLTHKSYGCWSGRRRMVDY